MNKITPGTARHFLNALELPPSRKRGFEAVAEAPLIDFNAQKNQAMVVASDIVSFVRGVSVERRQDITNACLIAQLAANRKVPDRSRIIDWYNAYFEVLENTGWIIQDKGFASYEESADGLEAHEAILKVAATLLAPSPTALMVITSTLEAMKSIESGKPWITLFDRESKHVNTARFQIALAEPGDTDQFLVSMMAFSLEAQSTLTRVLFFKIRSDSVKLHHCTGKVTINDDVLLAVRDQIKKRIAAYANDYIAALPDLG
jgi:hypothetical protein